MTAAHNAGYVRCIDGLREPQTASVLWFSNTILTDLEITALLSRYPSVCPSSHTSRIALSSSVMAVMLASGIASLSTAIFLIRAA